MNEGQPPRDALGRITEGTVLNPEGNNGHLTGWQRYGDRLQKWLNMPLAELKVLVTNQPELDRLSTIDVVCVRHASNMISGDNTLRERKEALDRIEGTPKQTVQLQGDKDKPVELKFSLDFHSPDQGDPVASPNASHDSQLPATEALPKAE